MREAYNCRIHESRRVSDKGVGAWKDDERGLQMWR